MAFVRAGDQAAVDERREHVASLLVRGATIRSITSTLNDAGIVCSREIVRLDIKAIEREWRKRCAAVVDAHRAQLLACYWDVYADARESSNLSAAREALGAIGAMLGTAAAPKAPLGPNGQPAPVLFVVGVSEGEV